MASICLGLNEGAPESRQLAYWNRCKLKEANSYMYITVNDKMYRKNNKWYINKRMYSCDIKNISLIKIEYLNL